MLCPMPVIRTQDRVRDLAPGDTVQVVCTDPGASNDVPAWCRINGHRVLEVREQGDEILIDIEVGSP